MTVIPPQTLMYGKKNAVGQRFPEFCHIVIDSYIKAKKDYFFLYIFFLIYLFMFYRGMTKRQ